MRTDPRHDEIRGQVEQDVANIEQRQTSGYLLRGQAELRGEVVAFLDIHSLCQSDIGADGRAHEVKDPESGEDATIKFADRV